MAALAIEFEWWRDPAGCDFVPAGPKPVRVHQEDLGPLVSGGAGRLVRRGGALAAYRPFEKVSGLYRLFAHSGLSVDGLAEFSCRFGPLTEEGLNPDVGDDVGVCIAHAKAMNDYLSLSPRDRVAKVSSFGERGFSWTRIDVALVVNPVTDRLQMRLSPRWLLHGLWLEFGLALSGDVQVKRCLQCGGWFEAGPGTGRREDAKFCADAHRIAFNSKKSKPGEI